MTNLYDGSRIWTSTANVTAITAANHNTLQDKLILGLEERSKGVSIFEGMHDLSAASDWVMNNTEVADPPYWSDVAVNSNDDVCIPLNGLRGDERITELKVVIKGTDATATEGEIGLYKKEYDATAIVQVQDIGGAAPWDQGGSVVTLTQTGLTIDVDSTSTYFLWFEAPSTGAGASCYIYTASYKSMFHKGT